MSDTLQTLGILGSGQLGRMIAIAAAQLGIRAVIFAPDAIGSPAADVAHAIITASYDDKAALDAFALQVDAVVTEFENVPADTMAYLGQSLLVCPGSDALRVAQNRIAETIVYISASCRRGADALGKRASVEMEALRDEVQKVH